MLITFESFVYLVLFPKIMLNLFMDFPNIFYITFLDCFLLVVLPLKNQNRSHFLSDSPRDT